MSDATIRRLTAAAVLLVAAIAAVVSFVHIEHLAATHGQVTVAAYLLPLSIDGTVVAASMVMLRAARAGMATPWLARVMLAASVAATLAANVAYGARYGLSGALLSGWPAAAFIGCAEMALGMVRRATHQSASAAGVVAPGPPAALVSKATTEAGTEATSKATGKASVRATPRPARRATVKATGRGPEAATEATRKAIAQGHPAPSARAIARNHHIARDKATEIRAAALADANGHGGQPGQVIGT
jgi:Protein of unknown function (DUF2637)